MKLTLGTDSNARKDIPVTSGVLKYAPAAIAGVAKISKAGNDKHNPGQPLHHARGKSTDHSDCIVRHTMDVNDIIAYIERNYDNDHDVWYKSDDAKVLLNEVSQLAWRALIWSQELHEKYGGAPLAPGARLPSPAAKQPKTRLTSCWRCSRNYVITEPVCPACKADNMNEKFKTKE
jgi:hypothetical protein